jgi:hypothetical protein
LVVASLLFAVWGSKCGCWLSGACGSDGVGDIRCYSDYMVAVLVWRCRSAEVLNARGVVEDPKRQSRSVRRANPVGLPWLAVGILNKRLSRFALWVYSSFPSPIALNVQTSVVNVLRYCASAALRRPCGSD